MMEIRFNGRKIYLNAKHSIAFSDIFSFSFSLDEHFIYIIIRPVFMTISKDWISLRRFLDQNRNGAKHLVCFSLLSNEKYLELFEKEQNFHCRLILGLVFINFIFLQLFYTVTADMRICEEDSYFGKPHV